MAGFTHLLRTNRNYRWLWTGQVVSEIGDHFNTIAAFSLILAHTNSGLAVSGVLLARALPMLFAGPLAGVSLDRFDRRKIMLASDLFRALIAIAFLLTIPAGRHRWLYVFSALLMFASPFFTSGRASILPTLTSREELHTANSMTQTTQWVTTAIGTFLGGTSAEKYGFEVAFLLNATSFLFSAFCIYMIRLPAGSFQVRSSTALTESNVMKPWHDYREGLRYMRSIPLVLAIAMVSVGWATGGGAAQILFSLFGERVFHRGAEGIGQIWGAAGAGLVCGGIIAHRITPSLSFTAYKRLVAVCYIFHGGAYVTFSLAPSYPMALCFIALSRASVAISSVSNFSMLLKHVSDDYRGRVFATLETLTWATMMFSMTAAGYASDYLDTRTIGVISGLLSSTTAVWWTWANSKGFIPEPRPMAHRVKAEEVEVHGDPGWSS